jgi:excisionase family DNA binding protein
MEYSPDTMHDENTEMDSLLTVVEVARMLNLHNNTVRRWSDQGVLPSFRIGRRNDRRFRMEDIVKLLRE